MRYTQQMLDYRKELDSIERAIKSICDVEVLLSYYEDEQWNFVFIVETDSYTFVTTIPSLDFIVEKDIDVYQIVIRKIVNAILEIEEYDTSDTELG